MVEGIAGGTVMATSVNDKFAKWCAADDVGDALNVLGDGVGGGMNLVECDSKGMCTKAKSEGTGA